MHSVRGASESIFKIRQKNLMESHCKKYETEEAIQLEIGSESEEHHENR